MTIALRTVKAVCPLDCPDTCSMVVTVDDATGKAVKLRGDNDHPITAGFLCSKVNHYLDRVYHAERLQFPMKRVGPKGSGAFERISWDEAINTITVKFKEIATSKDGPQAILPFSYAGTMGKIQGSSLDRRFFHRLGASLLDRTICASAGGAGCDITFGPGGRAVVDPEEAVNCRYIVNWGSNTVVTNVHFWKIEHEARKRGAKIVTIDPYRSPTAAKSDWWIPIRPGTDAALALGVMHIIFREGWQDQDYLDRYCLGAEELKQRALKEYPPGKVAAITGLSVEIIEQFAKEYANSAKLFGGPALIRLNYGLQRHGGGGMAVRTVTCLPALTADWRHPGAGALLSTSKQFPFNSQSLERPDLVPPGTRVINMTQLAEALNGEIAGPPVKAMFVYNSNPASICPDQSRVISGLKRDDLFTIVHEQFLTDTARYADIVLPATTQLEHFDIHSSYGHLYLQANPPSIKPLFEAKCNTDVFRLLGKAMGFESELFDISDEDLARQSLPKEWNELPTNGGVRLNLPAKWAPYAEGHFGTASGKCHLSSASEAGMGRDPLPHYIPPHEDPQTRPDLAAKYPLQMLCPPSPSFLNSTFANLDHAKKDAGRVTIEMHPDDALARNIVDGQKVKVVNSRGRFLAHATLSDNVKPGVVVTLGLRWAKDTEDGVNCNTTTSTALTDFGGGATFFDNMVDVKTV
ncbi:molybdopterin oxidoreductase family protein [soil metagenome]